jgi:hypothetical protein
MAKKILGVSFVSLTGERKKHKPDATSTNLKLILSRQGIAR